MNEDYDYFDEYGGEQIDEYSPDPAGIMEERHRHRAEVEQLRHENKALRHTLEMVKQKTEEIEELLLERDAAAAASAVQQRQSGSDRPQVEQLQF